MTDHLLAATVDHLAAANWMFATVNSEDAPTDPPEPVPRPGRAVTEDELPGDEPSPPGPDEITRFFGHA